MIFLTQLNDVLEANRNSVQAFEMSKYMRNHFAFFGIRTPLRRQILKEVWSANKQEVTTNSREIAKILFSKSEREFHYCGIDILIKELKNNYQKEDFDFIIQLIETYSWWDSVDLLAKYLMGGYLTQFPEEKEKCIAFLTHSDSLWLIRTAILFQLGYKDKTDFELLKTICVQYQDSKEFFIQKAIGWALREYGKCHPNRVTSFVSASNLANLSKKEALKNIVTA